MSTEPPATPAGLSTDVIKAPDKCPPDRLRDAARYAHEFVEHKERETRLETESDGDDADDFPDDVPAKATIMIKEIDDNRYYY